MLRISVGLCCGLMLAACDEPPAPATLTATPEKFVGTWDVSLDDCKAGRGPVTVIVAADEVLFSDSRLAVTGAALDGEMAARIDGHFKTEMAEWDGSIRLELEDGGRVLNVVNGSTLVPRVKCP
jgi:hypothetical protein